MSFSYPHQSWKEMVWKGNALNQNKSCTKFLNHIQELSARSISEFLLPSQGSFTRFIISLHSPVTDKEVEICWRWSFCLPVHMTESFLRAMLMWPDYTCVSAWEAVSATHAKCERGLTLVFLGAYSLLNKIAACGKEFAVPESTDVCRWGTWCGRV